MRNESIKKKGPLTLGSALLKNVFSTVQPAEGARHTARHACQLPARGPRVPVREEYRENKRASAAPGRKGQQTHPRQEAMQAATLRRVHEGPR
jgi:hypothetical protein